MAQAQEQQQAYHGVVLRCPQCDGFLGEGLLRVFAEMLHRSREPQAGEAWNHRLLDALGFSRPCCRGLVVGVPSAFRQTLALLQAALRPGRAEEEEESGPPPAARPWSLPEAFLRSHPVWSLPHQQSEAAVAALLTCGDAVCSASQDGRAKVTMDTLGGAASKIVRCFTGGGDTSNRALTGRLIWQEGDERLVLHGVVGRILAAPPGEMHLVDGASWALRMTRELERGRIVVLAAHQGQAAFADVLRATLLVEARDCSVLEGKGEEDEGIELLKKRAVQIVFVKEKGGSAVGRQGFPLARCFLRVSARLLSGDLAFTKAEEEEQEGDEVDEEQPRGYEEKTFSERPQQKDHRMPLSTAVRLFYAVAGAGRSWRRDARAFVEGYARQLEEPSAEPETEAVRKAARRHAMASLFDRCFVERTEEEQRQALEAALEACAAAVDEGAAPANHLVAAADEILPAKWLGGAGCSRAEALLRMWTRGAFVYLGFSEQDVLRDCKGVLSPAAVAVNEFSRAAQRCLDDVLRKAASLRTALPDPLLLSTLGGVVLRSLDEAGLLDALAERQGSKCSCEVAAEAASGTRPVTCYDPKRHVLCFVLPKAADGSCGRCGAPCGEGPTCPSCRLPHRRRAVLELQSLELHGKEGDGAGTVPARHRLRFAAALLEKDLPALKLAAKAYANKDRRKAPGGGAARCYLSLPVYGKETYYRAYIVNKHLSPHDADMSKRQPTERTQGVIDAAETDEINPGSKEFLTMLAQLSDMTPFAALVQALSRAGLREVPVGGTAVSVDGVPVARFAASLDAVEQAVAAALRAEGLHTATVGFFDGALQLRGQLGRLLHPVQLRELEAAERGQAWPELLRAGVVGYVDANDQHRWTVLGAEEPLPAGGAARLAREIDDALAQSHRRFVMGHQKHGHPCRLHYSVRQHLAAAGLVPAGPAAFSAGTSMPAGLIEGALAGNAHGVEVLLRGQSVVVSTPWGGASREREKESRSRESSSNAESREERAESRSRESRSEVGAYDGRAG